MDKGSFIDRDLLRRRRISVVGTALVLGLALTETVNAVVAPSRAPSEADWTSAAAEVRAGFQPGDLIVAAPRWADPLLRLRLGDLLPRPVAGRMDSARYGRVWEIAQRGARAAETAGGVLRLTSRHGALTVNLWEKPAARVGFDFLAAWQGARLALVRPGQGEAPCPMVSDRLQCGGGAALRPELVEVDTTLRNALAVDPVEHATLVLDYAEVPLSSELAVAAGLHNVWLRKAGDGKVRMRVLVDDVELGTLEATSASGWSLRRFDTAVFAGRAARVRFEIITDRARGRHFAFAAEARGL